MGGEGSGKSYTGALYGVCRSVYDAQFGSKLYWIVGADFEDAMVAFRYVLDFQSKLDNIESKSISQNRDQQSWLQTKAGQIFVTISAYDPTKLGRETVDGIIGEEVSRWYQEAFLRCENRLIRRFPNSWGFFSGSFESSQGWLPEVFRYGQGPNDRYIRSYSIPSWANTFIFPLGREDPAILAAESSSSNQRFMERFGGEPAPPHNLVLDEFRTFLHVDNEIGYDPDLPVYLAIDPGDKVYCVEFVQIRDNGEVWVLDELYETHKTHGQMIDMCMLREGWPLVRGGAIDVAAKQTHMGMPVPIEEWYKDTGIALWAQKQGVEDSIERLRRVLSTNPKTGRPRLRVHPSCKGLIAEMGGGPSPVDGGGSWMYVESRVGQGPPRAENDHACKALAYLLAGPFGSVSNDRTSLASATYLGKHV